jgi:hypothetical protein
LAVRAAQPAEIAAASGYPMHFAELLELGLRLTLFERADGIEQVTTDLCANKQHTAGCTPGCSLNSAASCSTAASNRASSNPYLAGGPSPLRFSLMEGLRPHRRNRNVGPAANPLPDCGALGAGVP